MSLAFKTVRSPVGELKLVASDVGLVAILWETERAGRVVLGEMHAEPGHPLLVETEAQLRQYFADERTSFELPLDMRGTAFQKQVWEALRRIPFGQTRSYGELAVELGRPLASRAVGAANGRNPVSVVVPCHRVVGSTGKLTGFAGGLEAKRWLLELEGGKAKPLVF